MTMQQEIYLKYCDSIQNAIDDCENLLGLFKEQRNSLLKTPRDEICISSITSALMNKNNILDSFILQQKELKQLQEQYSFDETQEYLHQKKLQELTSILEHLLIISLENEKIIRSEIL
ncbi:hypothetical protein AAEX28_14865 [Lentisphaerota bacterium WC36G]|nr:hypothetical protein LJT99_01620 [Lentisphaerae bacterium WC36]